MATARKPRLIDEIDDDRIEAPDGFSATEATEAMSHAFAGAGEAARTALETGRQLQEEFTAFWQQRFQSNTETATQIMKCRTLPQVLETQQAWAKSFSDQYSSYLSRTFEMMQSAMRQGFDRR